MRVVRSVIRIVHISEVKNAVQGIGYVPRNYVERLFKINLTGEAFVAVADKVFDLRTGKGRIGQGMNACKGYVNTCRPLPRSFILSGVLKQVLLHSVQAVTVAA